VERREEEGEVSDAELDRRKTEEVAPTECSNKVYFCTICYRGFHSQQDLEMHARTHLELGIDNSSCRMLAQPAGVI